MLPSKGRGGSTKENNKKMIFDRIQGIENSFGALCTEVSSFAKKKARWATTASLTFSTRCWTIPLFRLRDKYDELSGLFKQAADMEECNETLHNGLGSYSKALTLLADINDLEVQRLHGKVTANGDSKLKSNTINSKRISRWYVIWPIMKWFAKIPENSWSIRCWCVTKRRSVAIIWTKSNRDHNREILW